MKRLKLTILGSVLLILIIIQFIHVNDLNVKPDPSNDFLKLTDPSSEIAGLIKNACYDCHSNETVFPWYFKIAPVSWMLNNHITEARAYLNFSDWGLNSKEEQTDFLKACLEEINANEMPLFSYKIMHPKARLDENEKTIINNWVSSYISHNNDLQEDTSEN